MNVESAPFKSLPIQTPTLNSQSSLQDESDPRAWLELVEDDEFPLSMFYTSLSQKLTAEPEGAAPAPIQRATPLPSPKATA